MGSLFWGRLKSRECLSFLKTQSQVLSLSTYRLCPINKGFFALFCCGYHISTRPPLFSGKFLSLYRCWWMLVLHFASFFRVGWLTGKGSILWLFQYPRRVTLKGGWNRPSPIKSKQKLSKSTNHIHNYCVCCMPSKDHSMLYYLVRNMSYCYVKSSLNGIYDLTYWHPGQKATILWTAVVNPRFDYNLFTWSEPMVTKIHSATCSHWASIFSNTSHETYMIFCYIAHICLKLTDIWSKLRWLNWIIFYHLALELIHGYVKTLHEVVGCSYPSVPSTVV